MTKTDVLGLEHLERYRPIVPDWEAFLDALEAPLPLCVWTNTLRTSDAELEEHLSREGIAVDPVAWRQGAYKGPPSDRAGQCIPFAAGLYHIQEEVSLLPVSIMSPRPGERILDLCSAPGNKTAQTAVAMENTGTILANDRDGMRARATRGVLDRLGVVNATLTTADAATLPDAVGSFDRVLADVPCTCEGTSRKHVDALLQSGREASLRMHDRQQAILRRGVQLCRPGGSIVYATCTYAPEENEMVVDAVLQDGGIELEPVAVAGFAFSAGLTRWDGRSLDPSLERAVRVWPHQNDSGGFFVALLRKHGRADHAGDSGLTEARIGPADLPGALDAESDGAWRQLLRDRFGIPERALSAYSLHQPNNKYVAAVAADHLTVEQPEPVSVGMPLIRVGLRHPKLTTAGARLLGRLATRNVVRADEHQTRAYVDRREFHLTSRQQAEVGGTGYVLVMRENVPLGVGLYLEDHYVVRSMFPKVLSRAVSD